MLGGCPDKLRGTVLLMPLVCSKIAGPTLPRNGSGNSESSIFDVPPPFSVREGGGHHNGMVKVRRKGSADIGRGAACVLKICRTHSMCLGHHRGGLHRDPLTAQPSQRRGGATLWRDFSGGFPRSRHAPEIFQPLYLTRTSRARQGAPQEGTEARVGIK